MHAEHAEHCAPVTTCALPAGVTGEGVADAARDAFIEFCRGVARGWTKRDLAWWLVGPYADVARCVTAFDDDPPPSAPGASTSLLDPPRIAALLDPAWQQAVTLAMDLASGGGVGGLDEAFERRSLALASLDTGETVFLPVHRPRLSLAVRVRSLVVADFLYRPHDYRGVITACDVCGVLLLGAAARARGQCLDHRFESGIRPTAEGLELGEELLPAALRTGRP